MSFNNSVNYKDASEANYDDVENDLSTAKEETKSTLH